MKWKINWITRNVRRFVLLSLPTKRVFIVIRVYPSNYKRRHKKCRCPTSNRIDGFYYSNQYRDIRQQKTLPTQFAGQKKPMRHVQAQKTQQCIGFFGRLSNDDRNQNT